MAQWSKTNLVEITKNRRIDSEFFHPDYITTEALVNNNPNISSLGSLGDFLIGPFGSAFHVNNYDPNSEFRYVRGKDVKPFTLLDNDSVYMPAKDFYRLSRYALQKDDLLISVVGTLGNVAIVPDDVKGIFSCKSTLFRNTKVDPYYLLAYLNSKYGRTCLIRRQRGAIQMGLNKEDLKMVPVPLLDSKFQELIGLKIKKSLQLNLESKSRYTQATTLLEKELGLDKISFTKEKCFKASFSEIIGNNRGDAEFFNPQLRQYWKHFDNNLKIELLPITEFASVMKFGNPDYAFQGTPIITQKHLSDITPNGYGSEPIASISWVLKYPSAILRNDDLLFYSVGAYLGKTNIWLNKEQAVPASFITLLRPFSQEDAGYLMVLMNSNYGLLQSKVFQSGTSQQYIYPKDIRRFKIPNVSFELKKELYSLINQSHIASKESSLLLEHAKKEVEQLIEQAALRNE